MRGGPSSLPAYLRLPDGLRFAGTAALGKPGELRFKPKQAMHTLPPSGLPVHLVIAGIPGDEDEQFDIAGVLEETSTREFGVSLDGKLPYGLLEVLDPEAASKLPGDQVGNDLLGLMRETGLQHLTRSMRRFLVDLGDQLFDLSTSSRHGMSGQHAHYDALNRLKRANQTLIEAFTGAIAKSLSKLEKDGDGQSVADLEATSAQSLNLVALEEMDQKLAIDKIVSALIEEHRVELECLTIRAAEVAGIDAPKARTPFHPAYIVQAFVDAFADVTDDPQVMKDALDFFRRRYTRSLEKLYPTVNKLFIDAGIQPDLEEQVREQGSLLNPVEKRIVRSPGRSSTGDSDDETTDSADEEAGAAEDPGGTAGSGPQGATGTGAQGAPGGLARRASDAAHSGVPHRRRDDPPSAETMPSRSTQEQGSSKHDAMYEAVLHALQTQRQVTNPLPQQAPGTAAPYSPPSVSSGEAPADLMAGGDISAEQATIAADTSGTALAGGTALPAANTDQLLSILQKLQTQQPSARSLADLPSLEEVVAADEEGQQLSLDQEGASRLGFVDNVFRTLHNNFEVSPDMAPSLSRLRVPLARLSLQEPTFFAQPNHPAHQLLDKLSNIASADNSANRSVQKKVDSIVEEIVNSYEDDSAVFDKAQRELDSLLGQRNRVLDRNIQRVVSSLEGQEKLTRAQRRVESLLDKHIDQENAPKALVELLDDGWRSALVQLALREGEDSFAWREEAALLEKLVKDFAESSDGTLPDNELREMQHRLRALNKRLNLSNPGSVAHEAALSQITAVLQGRAPLTTTAYRSPVPDETKKPDQDRVEDLPRLRRWLKRVAELELGTRLRYTDKDGRKRQMKLVWTSDEKDRFVFVNERGQKVAELTAVQLARQLSRGAMPPTNIDTMSVVDQSVYETLEQAQKTLSFDRNRDSLTQLINKDSLMHQLKRSLRHAQTRGSEHAFMLLNIDRFSLVNEVFDETSGDQVLSEFAKLLAQLNDRRTLTARMEGDEFGILMTYRGTEEARQVADRIRKDIAESTLTLSGESVSFTVSIGITAMVQSSESADTVLEQTQAALELAKNQGRDQVVVFDVDQQELLDYKREKAASRKRLDEAMSTDSLVLRAQPIVQSAVDGSEGATHHYEVLLSLRGDDGDLQSPQEFIVSAERFGFVTMVDRWVLNEVFQWISELMDAQKEVPELSINLSGTSITDNDFLDYVLEQISEFGVGTSRLCFEITETGAIDNLPRAADFVRTLKNIGCKFSLDDFGTGLASHKYLRELPVDYVKIDGTFITDIHKNPTDFAMTKSISDLAHFLGQRTVAECVEDLEIIPSLREIGIDYLQGWGIGMPRELPEVMDELANLET